jgi:hypothetical protein
VKSRDIVDDGLGLEVLGGLGWSPRRAGRAASPGELGGSAPALADADADAPDRSSPPR